MRKICLPLLLVFFGVSATEYRPWFGEDKLIEITPAYTYQYVPQVDSGGTTFSKHSNNHFASLSVSAQTDCTWAVQGEVDTAATAVQGYHFEDYKLTLRYRPLSDCEGDPFSLTGGISVSQVSTAARRDLYTFHPGQMEYEAHLAIGKESICRQYWTSRVWGMFGAGIANRGSPWLRAIFGYDKNHWNCYHYGVYVEGLLGLGEHELLLNQPFRGYGAIKYRSLDITGYFTQPVGSVGKLTLEYTLRPWAYNFPTYSHAFTIKLSIPYAL